MSEGDPRDLAYRLAAAEALIARLSEQLEGAQAELQALHADLTALHDSRDDLASQMSIMQQAFKSLELRVRRSEAPRPPRATRLGFPTPLEARGTGAASVSRPVRPTAPATPGPVASSSAASPSATTPPREAPASAESPDGSALAVRHIEEIPALQQVVRSSTERWQGAYLDGNQSFENPNPQQRRLLVVNLLLKENHPLEVVAASAPAGELPPPAFVYCSDGTRGVLLETIDFFAPPYDPQTCTKRLLRRHPQRALLVSNEVDVMNPLRSGLTESGATVSMAFDARQALDLAPMINCDLVVIDLHMPRGEALRLTSRLRALPKTARIPIALLWTEEIDGAELHQQVLRITREGMLQPEQLGRAVSKFLNPR